MRELDILAPESFSDGDRARMILLVCDEDAIRCHTFRKIEETVAAAGKRAVLVIPHYQYQKGLRGWAKAQILAAIAGQIDGVMPLDYETARKELEKGWAKVEVRGPVVWETQKVITQTEPEIVARLPIIETRDPLDREMIARAKSNIGSSNCWFDPAGCVFVRDGEVLLEACSTSFNHSDCARIPLDFRELPLDFGGRMMFCDSLHAERVGISRAAEVGIPLGGSTMYVTKFPCRPCALNTITAGITSIVFDQGSYGLSEAADLFELNKITLKRVVG